MADEANATGSPRRHSSWNLKAIVEDVTGKPIGDFQEPGKPVHPYLRAQAEIPSPTPGKAPAPAGPAEAPYDPVGHLYPPLVGAHGREYHGPEHEHHAETLERHPTVPAGLGEKPRGPGPLHKPERLYLHYLLLHLDRLSDTALAYLRTAVEEEVAHRAHPTMMVAGRSGPSATTADATLPASAPALPMPAR